MMAMFCDVAKLYTVVYETNEHFHLLDSFFFNPRHDLNFSFRSLHVGGKIKLHHEKGEGDGGL